MEDNCQRYSQFGKTLAAITYVRMHGKYFGSAPVILDDRKSADGSPLQLALTEEFREENNIGLRFGVNQERGPEIINHLEYCSRDKGCVEANNRWNLVKRLFETGFPNVIALRCAIECGASRHSEWAGGYTPFHIPDKGYKDQADLFESFFRWFDGDNKSDWVWPNEVGWPRICGPYMQAKVSPEREIFSFKFDDPQTGRSKSASIPLKLIRKLVIQEIGMHSWTWWNPQIYHVDTLTDPENQGNINSKGCVDC